jgi:hypothetical protein
MRIVEPQRPDGAGDPAESSRRLLAEWVVVLDALAFRVSVRAV